MPTGLTQAETGRRPLKGDATTMLSKKSMQTLATFLFALIFVTLTLLAARPAPASADFDFCPPGEGAGQCGLAEDLNSLRGLSIDFETGRLYAADRPNHRVLVFTEDGKFVEAFGWGVETGAGELQTCGPASPEAQPDPSLCRKGIKTASPGGFSGPTKLAVDNIVGSASRHDVYVVDQGNRRIEKFHRGASGWELVWAKGEAGEAEGKFESRISVGVGPGGAVYALDNLPTGVELILTHRLQRLDPGTGEPTPPQCLLGERGQAVDMAVASDGSFWVVTVGTDRGVRKYSAGCAPVLLAGGEEAVDTDFTNATVSLAVDQADRVLLAANEARVAAPGSSFQTVTARDAAGEPLSRYGYGRLFPANPEGLAVGGAGVFLAFGEIFAGEAGIRRLDYTPVLPPPGPITAPGTPEVGEIGPTKASVVAEVNPEGEETEVRFEYVSREDYEAQGDSFEGPATESTPPQALVPESGREFRLHAVEAQIGCPDPATEAEDPESGCLVPEAEYLWRVVAENGDGAGEGTAVGPTFTTPGAPEILATFATEVGTDTARLGAELNAYEIPTTGYFEYVTDAQFQASGFENATKVPDVEQGDAPIDFGAADGAVTRSIAAYPLSPDTTYHYRLVVTNPLIEPEQIEGEPEELRTFEAPAIEPCPNDADRIGPGALLPDCRAYELVSPLDKEGGDIRVLTDEFGQLTVLEQAAHSGDRLAYGSARSFGGASSAPYTSQYIAERIAGSEWESHPINVARGRPLVGAPSQFHSEFKAFSADLCQAWIETYAEMPEAPPGFEPGFRNLLRREDRLCGPEGLSALAPRTTPAGIPSGSEFLVDLQGVSEDGDTIFTANTKLAEGGKADTDQLYESVGGEAPRFVCRLPNGAAFDGSCTAGTLFGNGQPRHQPRTISLDGERIFFSVGGAGSNPLYVRISGAETVPVSEGADATFWGAASDGTRAVFSTGDLAAETPTPATLHVFDVDTEEDSTIAGRVRGVLGISEDASRVYFASQAVLPGSGQNSEGEEAVDGESNLYLYEQGGGTSFVTTLAEADVEAVVSAQRYGRRTGYVTPDGGHAVFRSRAALTDYDNRQGGSATSCNTFQNESKPGQPCREVYRYAAEGGELSCVSCNPTGARPAGPSSIPNFQTPMHATRVISEDGARVYFESEDRLAARDSNGKVDVYQWEERGSGDCDEASYDYSAAAHGCVGLISSGQSLQDSRLVESSPDGRDVFFATASSLLPQDPTGFDVYDARVDGGLPIPPPPEPSCEGEACQSPPPAPEDPTPASSAFRGPGNLEAATPPPRCRRAKRPGAKGKRSAKRAKKLGNKAKRCRGRTRRASR